MEVKHVGAVDLRLRARGRSPRAVYIYIYSTPPSAQKALSDCSDSCLRGFSELEISSRLRNHLYAKRQFEADKRPSRYTSVRTRKPTFIHKRRHTCLPVCMPVCLPVQICKHRHASSPLA